MIFILPYFLPKCPQDDLGHSGVRAGCLNAAALLQCAAPAKFFCSLHVETDPKGFPAA